MKAPALFLTAILALAKFASAQVPLPYYDGFSYVSSANLAGSGSWLAGTGSGTIKVNGANLIYSGLQSSVGNDVSIIPTGSSARTYLNFTPQASGTVLFSFLLKINSLPNAQRLVAYGSNSTSSTTTPSLGFFVNAAGQLAVGGGTSSPQFTSSTLTVGATYLVVVAYTFGASDNVQIWMNPSSLGGSVPAPTGSFSASHVSSLSHFHWNTVSASSGGGSYEVDEFRIGSSYADVTPSTTAPPAPTPTPQPTTTGELKVIKIQLAGQDVILQGVGGPVNGLYEILHTADLNQPVGKWSVTGPFSFNADGTFNTTIPAAGLPRQFYVVALATSPLISTQPVSQPVAVGQDVSLSVTASGGVGLKYQWFKDGQTITNATSATFILANAQPGDAGSYKVVVGNSLGTVPSETAVITVSNPQTDGDFYVSPGGSDSNAGTISAPFLTLQKAISVAIAGKKIYLRGGTYYHSQTILISKSGTAGNPIKIWAYPGEKPLLDFASQAYGASNRGILLTGDYWDFKGLEIARAGDNALKIEGSHIRVELCVFHHNGDTGLQIGFAHETSNPGANLASDIQVINCDSYMNYDPDSRGGDADGFAAKLHCGKDIVFTGCRAWMNSDDGWDLFETDASVVINNCWTWHNGDGSLYNVTSGSFAGNGNGIKLGGNGTGGSSMGTHYALNCISFNNKYKGNAQGFTNNSHKDGLVVYNCLSFSNGSSGYNYFMEGGVNSGKSIILKNNVSFPRVGSATNVSIDQPVTEATNTWNLPVSANAADYSDLSEDAAGAPRKTDGSLPDGFARLVAGSDLIDKGTDVGAFFNGSAPDLGPFESAPE